MKTVYIGNLALNISDSDLTALFSPFGSISWVNVVRDKLRNASQGFGFVEMDSAENAALAITGLHGHIFRGKRLKVNEARPKVH